MPDMTPYELAVHDERQAALTTLVRAVCVDYNNAEVLNALHNVAIGVFLRAGSVGASRLICDAFCETLRDMLNDVIEDKSI